MADPNTADHIAAQSGGFEPHRQSNWEFVIGMPDGEILKLSAQSAAAPNESNEEIALPYGNEQRYVAGKVTYDTVPLVLRDFADQTTRKAMVDWRLQVFDPATGAVGLAKDYKRDATLTLYGPDGSMEKSCKLHGCWPQAVNWGTLDHGSSEPVLIEVTIRYDKAIWDKL